MARARYDVIGEYPIEERDDDGKWLRDVPPGGVVELDDRQPPRLGPGGWIGTNVVALIQTGCIKPHEEPADDTPTSSDVPATAAETPKASSGKATRGS